MAVSDEKIREYMKRLLLSRMRILCNHGFYGLLLMHMIYSIDEGANTAYTDGERIAFGPEFLENLSDSELDFVMMHEILHVVLQHCFRGKEKDNERYNIAADIVINSNIMLENGGNPSSITLSKYGESMHLAPDGKEGHHYDAEAVYRMLMDEYENHASQNTQGIDSHDEWGDIPESSFQEEIWKEEIKKLAKTMGRGSVLINLSGRGDKDMDYIIEQYGIR